MFKYCSFKRELGYVVGSLITLLLAPTHSQADVIYNFSVEASLVNEGISGNVVLTDSVVQNGSASATLTNGGIVSYSFTSNGVTDTGFIILELDLNVAAGGSIIGVNNSFLSGPNQAISFDNLSAANGFISGTAFKPNAPPTNAVVFSNGAFTAVPEPSSTALAVMTIPILLFRRRCRKDF